jgi:uncharacterized protein (TIGR02001 family)
MQKKALLTTAILSTAALPAVSMAELSANAGWVSDYIFRGVFQEDSSPYGGLDFASDSGLYAGVWGADVGLGLEVDLYFGYSGSFGDSGGYTIGATGYFYTEDGDPSGPEPGFYDTVTEVNLGISFGMFALEYAMGEEDGWGSPTDYTFTSVIVSPEVGPYYSFNMWGDEYDGSYIEVGYGWSIMEEVDFSIALLYALDMGDSTNIVALDEGFSGYADATVVFGVSKSFAIGE